MMPDTFEQNTTKYKVNILFQRAFNPNIAKSKSKQIIANQNQNEEITFTTKIFTLL